MKCKICGTTEFIVRGENVCLSCYTTPMKEGDLVIGIDPDCELNGFAIWDIKNQKLDVQKLSFFDIFDMLSLLLSRIALVRIEAGWLNKKSNFHSNPKQSKAVGEKIAKSVGRNHETGLKLVEMCKYLGIACEEVKPLGTKGIDQEMFKKITKFTKRTNEDMRDAGMLVFKYK